MTEEQKPKHTAAPWVLDRDSLEIWHEGKFLKPIAVVRGWAWLTKAYTQDVALAQQMANAELIARAPELEAKNQRLREALFCISEICHPGLSSYDKIMSIVSAALSSPNQKPKPK